MSEAVAFGIREQGLESWRKPTRLHDRTDDASLTAGLFAKREARRRQHVEAGMHMAVPTNAIEAAKRILRSRRASIHHPEDARVGGTTDEAP